MVSSGVLHNHSKGRPPVHYCSISLRHRIKCIFHHEPIETKMTIWQTCGALTTHTGERVCRTGTLSQRLGQICFTPTRLLIRQILQNIARNNGVWSVLVQTKRRRQTSKWDAEKRLWSDWERSVTNSCRHRRKIKGVHLWSTPDMRSSQKYTSCQHVKHNFRWEAFNSANKKCSQCQYCLSGSQIHWSLTHNSRWLLSIQRQFF